MLHKYRKRYLLQPVDYWDSPYSSLEDDNSSGCYNVYTNSGLALRYDYSMTAQRPDCVAHTASERATVTR